MTCPDCDKPIHGTRCVCGFQVTRIVLTPPTAQPQLPAGVSRDSFGRVLYDCIQLIAQIKMIRLELDNDHDRPKWKQGLEKQELKLVDELDGLLPRLLPEDQQALMARYPDVVSGDKEDA